MTVDVIPTIHVKLIDQGIDWPAWVAAAVAFLTLVVLAVTARYAYRSAQSGLGALEDARRSRHAQLILALDQQWSSAPIIASMKLYGKYTDKGLIDLVERMFGPNQFPATDEELSDYESLAAAANLIETIGVLCEEGTITHDVIYKVWGGSIVYVWRAWEDAVANLRRYLDEADAFVHFERTGRAMEARLPETKRASSDRGSRAGEAEDSGTSAQTSMPKSTGSSTGTDTWLLLRRFFMAVTAVSTLMTVIYRSFRGRRKRKPNLLTRLRGKR
jgi:hypothetical protein